MKNWEYKTFKDSLHGYIRIPVPFVKHFIDTELFQRLRNIEQTGMRTLYPSAMFVVS
jgi:HD superfamily phosphohydrolase